MKYITTLFIMNLLFVSSVGYARDSGRILETDWLEAKVGSTGDVLGAEVVKVLKNLDSEITIIELKLPVKNPEAFEGIEVIGKKTREPVKQQDDAEWIRNYEDGAYGLRLRLKKAPDFQFLIRMIDKENE